MFHLSQIQFHPAVILVVAILVLWVSRAIMNFAFKVVLVFAVAGTVAVMSGETLPNGMTTEELFEGLTSGMQKTVEIIGLLKI